MHNDLSPLLLISLFIIVLALLIRPLWRLMLNIGPGGWLSLRTTGSLQRTAPYTKVARLDGSLLPTTEEINKALQSALQETSTQQILVSLATQIQTKSKASITLPLACIYILPLSKEHMDMEILHLYSIRVTLTHTQRPVQAIGSKSKSPPSETM